MPGASSPQPDLQLSAQRPVPAGMARPDWKPELVADARLHNAYRLHEKVISGGSPEEAGMQALRELGIRMIISVDGVKPDVETA